MTAVKTAVKIDTTLFNTETELNQILAKCRKCFRDIIERKPNMHGSSGREYMLAVCTDLTANGATDKHIKMFAKLVYGGDYDENATLKELRYIQAFINGGGKPWRCDELKTRLPSYVNPDECVRCEKRREDYREGYREGNAGIKTAKTKTTEGRVFSGAFGYIDRIVEKNPLYFDTARNYWLWDSERRLYNRVDETTILLTILQEIADPAIIEKTFKQELLEAARLRGRDAAVKKVPDEWIYFENGVIDIKTGERFEPTPEYLFTEPIPHKISSSEETPTIDALFRSWVPENKIALLYEIVAYCLYNGYPIHRMFILVGRGRNGKGQYRDLIVRLVGVHNRTASTLEQLINSRFESARLEHKKICTMGEINYTLLDRTALLKMLSGGDPIPAERKNKEPYEFVNTAKLIINTNSVPQTADKTDAWYARCVAIEFLNQFHKGKDIIDTVPDEEYNNLLTKSIRILKELLDRGEFTGEGDIRAKEREYERLANPLTQFINTYCEKNPDYNEATWRLLERYEKYCDEKGYKKPMSKNEFNDMLRVNYDVEKKRLKDHDNGWHEWVWVFGIRLRACANFANFAENPISSPIGESYENLAKTAKLAINDSEKHHEHGGRQLCIPTDWRKNTENPGAGLNTVTGTESSQLDLIQHIRNELIKQDRHFPEGINEHLIALKAKDWGVDTEDVIISTITHLIDRGNINVIRKDEKDIRYIRWVGA